MLQLERSTCEQKIWTSSADVVYLMNRVSHPGERQMSSEVGGNCCFWREVCFLLGMGDAFNLSLLKAQRDPEILSGGKTGLLASPSESY